MKRWLWMLALAPALAAQNPQTQTAPPFAVNATWTNGTAPGYAPTAGSGLTLNVGPGTVNCAATITTYAGGTLTMTASSTNYVYLNTASSCAPAVKTTAYTTSDIPIATVTASGSAITAISDVRGEFANGVGAAASVPWTGVTGAPTFPATLASAAHQWFNSYTSSTGLFTQTQPTLADIAAGTAPSGAFNFSATTLTLPSTYVVGSATITQPGSTGTLALTSAIPSACGSVTGLRYSTGACSTDVAATSSNVQSAIGAGVYDASGAAAARASVAACSANQYATATSTSTLTCAQVAYSQVSGTPTLPATLASAAHQWFNSYTASTGLFTQTQPTLADIAAGASPTGTFDFSGATQLKLPVAAGYTSAANGELGYDSTNLNWHGWANGADEFFAGFSVASPPTSGHFAEFLKSTNAWSLTDGGAIGAMASGAYPGAGIANSTGSGWGTSYSTGTGASNLVLGGTITAGGPTGGVNSIPVVTYNAAGQLTAVTTATPAIPISSGVTGLGTGAAAALGDGVNTSGGFVTQPVAYGSLATLSANQVVGALTATTPSGLSVPSCSGASNALIWTSGTGFGCNTISGSGTINAASQYSPAYYSAAGSATTLSGVTPFNGFGYFSTSGAPAAATATNLGALINLTGILYGNGTSAATVASSAQMIAAFGTSIAANTAFGNFTGSPAAPSFTATTGTGSPVAATSPTLVTPLLGTPTSGVITNLTGVCTACTANAANGLNSATTDVAVSAATAPTVGQVLQATSSTVATWQTPANPVGTSLASFYRLWNTLTTQVVRIENLGDSIITCNQQAPCAYGPSRIGSTFTLQLINELAQRYQQYSTGFRAIVRLANGTTTVSAGDGYTNTGTVTNSTLLGPQESGVSLNGGSLLTFSSGAVLTIAVGQPYSSVTIGCVPGTGISGYTVTINGSSVGTACGAGSGTAAVSYQNFANPVAQASQPGTGSTLTLTALGATNYLYGYDAVLFCGASQSACTTGFTVDNFGVGGASSPWFASGTKTGSGSAGMVWVNALPGKVGLCVLENGENDANASSGVTSTQQNTQNQAVATACQTLGASVLFWVPPPYNSGGSPATYSALQQGSLTYCQAQGWACMNMADLFMGGTSGTLSGLFQFTSQDTGAGATPPWSVAQGLVTSSDSQHLNDCGELLVTQQFLVTVLPHVIFNYPTSQACNLNPQNSGISSAYTNATTGFTTVAGASSNTGQLEFVAPVSQTFTSVCRGDLTVGTTGVVDFQVIGSASISTINATLSYQTTATSAYSVVGVTALSSALATSSITAASGLSWQLIITGVNSTTNNSFAVQAHEASGTLTIPAGATCITQLSGPQ